MCFTFLTGCFGAINTSTRNIDFDGNYNTVRHTERCFRAACKVSTNQRVLGSCEVGLSVPPKLQGKGSWRRSQPTKESLASGCGVSDDQSAVRSGRQSDRMGISEAMMVGRKVDREIIARRNSRRDGMMMKLNFCFFFCRRWWAFLLLQLHMLQALAQDDVAPYFKTEPGLPQIHLEGNRLVLTCLAEGSWPLEFKWLHNDSEITTYSSEYK